VSAKPILRNAETRMLIYDAKEREKQVWRWKKTDLSKLKHRWMAD